jgi:hypothetical protein
MSFRDGSELCPFVPQDLGKFKRRLFERIGKKLGHVVRFVYEDVEKIPEELIPIIGCSVELRDTILNWKKTGRDFIYWDRGYARRMGNTWLPRGRDGGFYRFELNDYQMKSVRDVPMDRWDALNFSFWPWHKQNRNHIVVAEPSPTYKAFHGIFDWTEKTRNELSKYTDRTLVIRPKDSDKSLQDDLKGAHALVTHGSISAVEAALLGYPVFVDESSAARFVGQTDLSKIESPVYPDRKGWVASMAYSQFNEEELIDGTAWSLIA